MSDAPPASLVLEPDLDDRLSAIATVLDRPKSWVIRQAVEDYLALQEWQLAAIDEGLRAAEAGRVIPHEAVDDWVKSWGTPDERPMPECG